VRHGEGVIVFSVSLIAAPQN